jgi:hypothetical protein
MGVNVPKRIKWKSTDLGHYGYVFFDYQGNLDVQIIPRAKGVKIRSTTEMGGGLLNITVVALVAKDSRTSLEEYISGFDTLLTLNTEGTLQITDDNGTINLTNCYLDSFTQSAEDLKVNTITFKFIKSL